MPTISYFYGISIRMYFDDHAPPHFHAVRGSDMALVEIATGAVVRGSLKTKDAWRVRRWALANRQALMANWELAQSGSSMELHRIPGLDEDDA